jgi:hypothetical protein
MSTPPAAPPRGYFTVEREESYGQKPAVVFLRIDAIESFDAFASDAPDTLRVFIRARSAMPFFARAGELRRALKLNGGAK